MPFLSHEEILAIVSAVTSSELTSERDALLVNINSEYKAGLPQTNAPSAQILGDLGAMNRTEELVDGTLPLRIWLQNAILLVGPRKQRDVFQAALNKLNDAQAAVEGKQDTTRSTPQLSDELRQRYLAWMIEHTATFKGPGISVPQPVDEAWWPVRARWSDDRTEGSFDADRILDASNQRLALISPGGGGKSTLSRRVAHELAAQSTLVVRVRLRPIAERMRSGASFLDALSSSLADVANLRPDEAAGLLASTEMLLADGLDECGNQRDAVASALCVWAAAHVSCRILVTVRSSTLDTAVLPGFRVARLLPLEQHAAETHVERTVQSALEPAMVRPTLDAFHAQLKVARLELTPLHICLILQLALVGASSAVTRAQVYERLVEAVRSRPQIDRDVRSSPDLSLILHLFERIGWRLQARPSLSLPDLVQQVGDDFVEASGEKPLIARQTVEEAIRFWEDGGLLHRFYDGGTERIEFFHESFLAYAAGRVLALMHIDERDAWLREHHRDRAWREPILFAAGVGGEPVVRTLLALVDPNDGLGGDLLLAIGAAAELPEISADLAGHFARAAAPLLASRTPVVARDIAEAMVPLAPRAPDAFIEASSGALGGEGIWNVLAALRVILSAAPARAPFDVLSNVMAHLSAPDEHALVPPSLERDHESEWGLWQPLMVPGVLALLAHQPGPETEAVVEKLFVKGDRISAGAHLGLLVALGRIGRDDLVEKYRIERDRKWGSRLSTWKQDNVRNHQADLAFLSLVQIIVGDPKNADRERSRTSALGRLHYAMGWGRAPAYEWSAHTLVRDIGGTIAVLRGFIVALSIDADELAFDVIQVREQLVSSARSDDAISVYSGLFGLNVRSPQQPDWDRTNSIAALPVPLLIRALRLPGTVLPRGAMQLLAHHRDRAQVASSIELALALPDENVVFFATAFGRELWGDRLASILIAALRAPTELVAPLYRKLVAITSPENADQVVELLLDGLRSGCGQVVEHAAAAAASHHGPDDERVDAALDVAFSTWHGHAQGTSGNLHKIDVGIITCGTTLYADKVAALLLRLLIARTELSTERLVTLTTSTRDVERVAIESLADRASSDATLLAELLVSATKGNLSIDLLEKLLALSDDRLRPVGDSVLGLHRSSDPRVRAALVDTLPAEWTSRENAQRIALALHDDPDPRVRSAAGVALRELERR